MLVAAWVILACIPAYIAQRKGRSAAAFLFYGLVVPPIAIVHAVLMRDNDGRVPCPACAERIMPTASVCPHCHSAVSGLALAPPKAIRLPDFSMWHVVAVLAIVAGLAVWSGNFRF